jgi:hypothetical protein
MRIALVTAAQAIPLDEDLPPLGEALRARGATVELVCWDDASADWSRFDLALIRSPWDYCGRRDEFVDWARRAGACTRLHNPAPVTAWNTDKHYLAELARQGATVVSTTFVEPGDAVALPGQGEVVIKPAISAGAKNTARYDVGVAAEREAAAQHVRALLEAGRSVMVQPFLAAVEQQGETALVYLDGRFSHAIRKGPLLARGGRPPDGLFAPEDIRPRRARPDELEVGARVLEALRHVGPVAPCLPLLYVRIDLIRDGEGQPRLLELEVTEPSLFLDAAAAGRLADAVLARARSAEPAVRRGESGVGRRNAEGAAPSGPPPAASAGRGGPLLRATRQVAIEESEVELSFVRASGPGGQNVNKVATAVQLRFDVTGSPSLSEEVRQRLLRLAGQRVSAEGVLVLTARRYRSQERNRQDALARLLELLRKAAVPPKPRRPTRPSRASRERRLGAKRRRGELKQSRRPRGDSD